MRFGPARFLAAFEGLEGGFAIGTSLLFAFYITGLDKDAVILAAIIGVIVSGFNSSCVTYSSEHYADELDGREKRSPIKHYFVPAAIEFLSYSLLGILCILPFALLNEMIAGLIVSTIVTIVILFLAGLWRGYLLRMNGLRDGTETALIGVLIIGIGALSGWFVGSL